ncbi:NAD kinase [Culex quinquefasciatus]|uniref:NAD kinase n=1 Tax=Culex quinquefasciatus TaxID=7176 RepID=UPI0018E316FE|nr:NAD kinase [Culex quinquefasciatus]
MAYLSDVDLATLHRSRLEERVHYKLSTWWNHRSATVDSGLGQAAKVTPTSSRSTTNMDDIINNNNRKQQQSQQPAFSTCNQSNTSTTSTAQVTSPTASGGHHRAGAGRHQSNVHVIKQRRSRNSNSCSSSGSTSTCEGRAGGGNFKHVEWSDDDYLNDDGYFSSETRRRRSGTWPRTRSLNAPSPFQQFGPCGRIMKNSAMVMQIQDPASQRLTWYKPPLAVLVIKKVRDSKVLLPFVKLVEWLIQEKHMVVWVEGAILDDPLLTGDKRFTKIQDKLITFKDGRDDLTDKIDFIICLGGDGTLLYASLLFQKSVPPVMAFHLGSLGFLTPFQFDNFQEQVTNVLEGHAALTLRSRLRCIIVRKDKTEQEISTFKSSQDPTTNILVLNEVVIDRGMSSYLTNIDLFLDGKHITSVQGDGLIVSTPTGSTAYSAAAGASMIHPSVPAILVSPICPHSLSFRPIVLPAGVELKIALSPDSRNSSWVSFDGRNRQELLHGDSLHVTTSIYPVPSICAQDQIADWFDSLAECLHWNVRKRQKCLDELSDLTGSGTEDSAIEEIERGMENLES